MSQTDPSVAPTVPVCSDDACASFDLRRTSRVVCRLYEAVMAPCGLTLTQWGLLHHLADEPVPLAALAAALEVDRTSLRRMLDPMERDGLVEVVPGPDRRTRRIAITAAGREASRRAARYWAEAQRELLETVGAEHWIALSGLLDTTRRRVKARLAELEAPPSSDQSE